ncbi:type II toxin-antitoxin system RelE/ParE family toxin [Desulfovibrio sp. JC022]|uniref:type II toxin-antitoxin system RelE/ParE family toxin n=1 Tax=Desulfovibrio sp. JC022 TaxID=2593642 RepID=UPI0013D6553A|nr:type II toxin-antitoxin system RelE/ParE family toxin [Desulfovibrio sp. JC022]NDV22816.1 type II toxin-antitoxin system RelE/ParE family toxin [Desulfovibrio sp. JC022]
MFRIVRSQEARQDLIDIYKYIAVDDPDAANRILDRINERVNLLAKHPLLGPAREDIRPGLRYLTVGNYIALYKVESKRIVVVRVLHGKRELEGLFTAITPR